MIRYAKTEHCLILRFLGEVRYTECAPLNELLNEIFSDTVINSVLIDLTQASSIDSTGLGLLARINNHVADKFHHKTVIFSTHPDINRTLQSMAFDKVFVLINRDPSLPVEDLALPEQNPSDQETTKVVLEAHKNLANLNDTTWLEFSALVKALEKEQKNS